MALARWQATITDEAGNIVPNADIEVRREIGGQPLVPLFSDRDGLTSIGNPFTTGPDGFAAFHVAGGAYQIKASKDAFERIWRYVPIGLLAENDAIGQLAVTAIGSNTPRSLAERFRDVLSLKDFGARGDGLTDDYAAVQAAWTYAAANNALLYAPAGIYNLSARPFISSASTAWGMVAAGCEQTIFRKTTPDAVTVIEVQETNGGVFADFQVDGNYSGLLSGSHGFVLFNCNDITVSRVKAYNYINTGILSFNDMLSVYRGIYFLDCKADGLSTANNGLSIVDAVDSGISGFSVRDCPGNPGIAVQLKNHCVNSFIEDGYSEGCSEGLIFGREGINAPPEFCRAGNITIKGCNTAVQLGGGAANNHVSAVLIDMANNPGTDLDAIDIQDGCVDNVVDGVSAYNVATAREVVRFRDNTLRNFVRVSDFSQASGNIVGFNSGATKNRVVIEQSAGAVTDITGRIRDDSGNTDNSVHAPGIGQLIGSISGRLHWKQGASGASFLSTQDFRFETDGDNIIGLAAPGTTGENYGISVNIAGTSNYASITYVKGVSASADYWGFKVGNALQLRLFDGVLRPEVDNDIGLGNGSFRYTELFAVAGTINTSDEREKQQISKIPDEWLDAWGSVDYYRYKWKSAVTEKGDGARWHTGLIAQRVRDAFESRGINAFEIGLLCYDEWDGQTGAQDHPQAGNRYSLRYDEALAMEAAFMRRELDRVKRLEKQAC